MAKVITPNDVPAGTKAYVDGAEVKNVGLACPSEGWVEYAPEPVRGREDDPECVYTERMYGKVKIKKPRSTSTI